LEDLTWDIDREVFLANTTLVSHDEPLAFVPATIREWIGLGWKLGSYHDTYVQPEEVDPDPEIQSVDDGEYERLEQLHTMPKTRRSTEFNQFFEVAHERRTQDHAGRTPGAKESCPCPTSATPNSSSVRPSVS